MRKFEFGIVNTFAFIILIASVTSHAGEVGRSGQRSARGSAGQPPVVASSSDRSRISVSGTLRQSNTGAASVFEVGRLVNQAATQQQHDSAVRNVQRTNSHRTVNITNLNGCTLITRGHTSCYGVGDGFRGRPTKVGIPYNPHDMTAAFNSYVLLGQIIVARNPQTGVARALTVTDTGNFGKKYGRVADLSAGAVEQFGLRCSPASGSMDNIEIYACPNK